MYSENKEYLFNVKVFYKNGKYKYANLFDKNFYNMGIELGTITGYRKNEQVRKIYF